MKPNRILRLAETQEKVGLGRDAIYRGGREGWFPKRVKLGARASGWIEAELDEWIAQRVAQRDSSPARKRRRRDGEASTTCTDACK